MPATQELTARFATCPGCGVEQVLWPAMAVCVECEQGPAEPIRTRGETDAEQLPRYSNCGRTTDHEGVCDGCKDDAAKLAEYKPAGHSHGIAF